MRVFAELLVSSKMVGYVSAEESSCTWAVWAKLSGRLLEGEGSADKGRVDK